MSQGYIHISNKGDFKNTEKFFIFLAKGKGYLHVLEKYGQRGVEALSITDQFSSLGTNTIVIRAGAARTGGVRTGNKQKLATFHLTNSNINKGVNIALILQYGHGTRNGGWVEGIDYINPALRSIFKNMADEAWEVIVDYV